MTKYKWALLGFIISAILFLVFLISPLISLKKSVIIIPKEPIPEAIKIELASTNSFLASSYDIPEEKLIEISPEDMEEFEKQADKDYKEWYVNVPKKIKFTGLGKFGKSFYHWNLFWIPMIVFYFMAYNYKK